MKRAGPRRPRPLQRQRGLDNEQDADGPTPIIVKLSLKPHHFEMTHHSDNDADGLAKLIRQLAGS